MATAGADLSRAVVLAPICVAVLAWLSRSSMPLLLIAPLSATLTLCMVRHRVAILAPWEDGELRELLEMAEAALVRRRDHATAGTL